MLGGLIKLAASITSTTIKEETLWYINSVIFLSLIFFFVFNLLKDSLVIGYLVTFSNIFVLPSLTHLYHRSLQRSLATYCRNPRYIYLVLPIYIIEIYKGLWRRTTKTRVILRPSKIFFILRRYRSSLKNVRAK